MKRTFPTICLLLGGCAATASGVQGGKLLPYDQMTQRPDVVYLSGSCKNRDGSPATVSDSTEYEVRRQGATATLFTHSQGEKEGRLIDNRWVENGAHHYFVWLDEVRGFEYVIPGDQGREAERRIYSRPQLRRARINRVKVVTPVGKPDLVCELVPAGSLR
jgi:hypothetical protein